ncbi:hypothetical protein [Paraburkholderia sp. BL21I4N1]|uniref:hypothetical protein n=1 Tax=Paraburkholderia sp. BL21I4N1 TaxID=1938801 RepID=UPI000CFC3F7D|nr:hypothetical protein [Paraburkholderia sp. BL21I4N1]PQV53384.1 hypothetical protein B0G83_102470 [Paraburkholderia sp. BL21I4N1]
MATGKAAGKANAATKTKRTENHAYDWKPVRGKAWSRTMRSTVERVLNRSEDLPPRLREPHFRAHLLLSLKHIVGDGPDVEDGKGTVWEISGRRMDKLNEGQREKDGGATGNAWTRWENGANVPSEDKIRGTFGLFPGHETVLGTDHDGNPFKAIDVGFAELYWSVGPCADDTVTPIPLWAMMGCDTSTAALWVPVLRYHDGSGEDGHAVADHLDTGVAFVRSDAPVPSGAKAEPRATPSPALEGKARIEATRQNLKLLLNRSGEPNGEGASDDASGGRSMFPKPGFTPSPDAAPSAFDGPARAANLRLNRRPLLNPDLSPAEQVMLLKANTSHQAQQLSELGADGFLHLMGVDSIEPAGEGSALSVGDVIVLALATTFAKGERGDLRSRLEDPVFTALRERHRKIVRWAQAFGIEAAVRRWLRTLHSDYLDRNGHAFLPMETPARPDEELVYDRDDPEAEYQAYEDNVPTVTAERARPGRLSGDQRLSRRRKA